MEVPEATAMGVPEATAMGSHGTFKQRQGGTGNRRVARGSAGLLLAWFSFLSAPLCLKVRKQSKCCKIWAMATDPPRPRCFLRGTDAFPHLFHGCRDAQRCRHRLVTATHALSWTMGR